MPKVVVSMIVGYLLAGCAAAQPVTKAATTRPTPATAATTHPAGRAVMATVNGAPIYMDQLHDLLVRSQGLAMAQQLIASELVEQAAKKQNLSASDAEVQAEETRTLERLFGGSVGADQREQLLEQLLTEKGIPHEQWRMILYRNILLAKLAEPGITVTDQQIKDAFEDLYGRKVEVRHIQCDSLTSAQEILKKLGEGANFTELAGKESTNATARNGGLLPPIGARSAMIPPPIRGAACALTKVGELSPPVQSGTTFHILRLEKVIEPQNVRLEDVKDKLAANVKSDAIHKAQQQILLDLIRSAQKEGRIQYADPFLKAAAAENRETSTETEPADK